MRPLAECGLTLSSKGSDTGCRGARRHARLHAKLLHSSSSSTGSSRALQEDMTVLRRGGVPKCALRALVEGGFTIKSMKRHTTEWMLGYMYLGT
jgi:hypothetical protein